MCSKLVLKRSKYSSLLTISMMSGVLSVKGPLGINYLKIPSSDLFEVKVDGALKCLIIAVSLENYRGKSARMKINSFISIFEMLCYTSIFGSMSFLHLEGLGLRFVGLNNLLNNRSELKMKLGNSAMDFYYFSGFRAKAFIKDPRNLILYGIDFSILRNIGYSIVSLKKPDKYKSKGLSISHIS